MPDLDFDGVDGPITSSGIGNAQRAYGIECDKEFGPLQNNILPVRLKYTKKN